MRETAGGLRKDWGEVERTLRMDEDMQATARALQRTGPKLARFGELLGILADQIDEQNRPRE
jgi:hypothetical protein